MSSLSPRSCRGPRQVWRRTELNLAIVREWLRITLEPDVVGLAAFSDQSVLGLLAHHHALPMLWLPGLVPRVAALLTR